MGIDITIKQKGSVKKEIPMSIILGEDLEHGYFDGVRLSDNEEDGDCIVYNSNLIGRGFPIYFSEDKKDIDLRLSFPTSKEEINDLILVVKRIAEFCECDIEVDDEKVTIDELENRRESFENGSLEALNAFSKYILDDEYEDLMIYGVMWILFIGRKEAELFSNNIDLSVIRDYLHEKQDIDAYYAKPMFYRDKNTEKVIGMYVLSEDTRSIFPIKPYISYNYRDENGEFPFEVDEWMLTFVQSTEKSHDIMMDYEKFINALPESSKQYFDARNVMIEGVSVDEYVRIAEKK